jgi:hypothetical protein
LKYGGFELLVRALCVKAFEVVVLAFGLVGIAEAKDASIIFGSTVPKQAGRALSDTVLNLVPAV